MLHRLYRFAAALVLCALCHNAVAQRPTTAQPVRQAVVRSDYMLAPFGRVALFRPVREPRGILLYLSDRTGWSAQDDRTAGDLAQSGLLVAGISTPTLMQAEDAWRGSRCVNPNYALIRLSRDVQHRMAVRMYRKPLIFGRGLGGTLAYAALAQWKNAAYQGVVSQQFSPLLPGHKPWCRTPGFLLHPTVGHPPRRMLTPNRQMEVPWVLLDPAGQGSHFAPFVGAVPHARIVDTDAAHAPALRDLLLSMLPEMPDTQGVAVPDMPLTIVKPAAGVRQGDVMAIVYSGDGGWVGIGPDVAAALAARGIPSVGVDSLSYFWSARTPAGASRDLGQLIQSFARHWGKSRVLLVGYSFGADALPLMVERLDPAIRAHVARLSMLGFSNAADFQFHLASWMDITSDNAIPTVPAVQRLRGLDMQCVRGVDESDSACPAIPRGTAAQFVVPGGHHFDRNSDLLTRIILGQRRPGYVNG